MEEELLREFLDETVCSLKDLRDEISQSSTTEISADFLRRFFRRVHTIKGTAQSLGQTNLSRFAHKVENLLSITDKEENRQAPQTRKLIESSLDYLLGFCEDEDYALPQDFSDVLDSFSNDRSESSESPNPPFFKVPENLRAELSALEIARLDAALQQANFLYVLEVFFEITEFNQKFRDFRARLEQSGEVIATAASKNPRAHEIGFRIFFVSKMASAKVLSNIADFRASLIFSNNSSRNGIYSLEDLLSNLIEDARRKAASLDKKIRFESKVSAEGLSKKHLVLINYVVLHLLRNAVDHAIESRAERHAAGKPLEGRINLEVFQNETEIILKVSDDGRGIDTEKLTRLARAKGILEKDTELSETEKLNLVFTHGFSTSRQVSELSGRGIGLDAVRDFVEQANGKISIETSLNRGTLFEIRLPF